MRTWNIASLVSWGSAHTDESLTGARRQVVLSFRASVPKSQALFGALLIQVNGLRPSVERLELGGAAVVLPVLRAARRGRPTTFVQNPSASSAYAETAVPRSAS